MQTKSIERFIVAKPGFQFCAGKKWNDARCDANEDCPSWPDVSARRRDYDEAAKRAGTKSKHTGFSAQRVLEHRPGERGNRSGESRGHKCVGGDSIRRQGAPRVESVPAHPEQACSDHA